MRIVCLIAIGAFSLSIAISEIDLPIETNVQRIPRALVLQPVMKVNTKEEEDEEEDGPLDWIANFFSRMIKPQKKAPLQPQLLGPIRVPGLNDDVFIKQLQSMMNSNSRVVIRVMPQHMQMPMESTPYNNQQPQTSHYHHHQPVTPTKQVPLQEGGFVPVSQLTLSSWTRPQQQHNQQHPRYQYGYNEKFHPQHQYQHYLYSHRQQHYSPGARWHHQPYIPSHYSQRNPYGTYDFDNSIPHNSGGKSNFSPHPIATANYPLYPPFKSETHDDTSGDGNTTIIREDQTGFEHGNLYKATSTSAEVSDNANEVYRADRIVTTNPTWKKLFWTKAGQKTTTSTTTERTRSDDSDRQKKSISSRSRANGYSATDIHENAASDLKSGSENAANSADRSFDSGADEDRTPMKDGTLLGRGESQEHIQNIRDNRGIDWKLMESTTTSMNIKIEQSSIKNSGSQLESPTNENLSSIETETPKISKKVMSSTANNPWRYQDVQGPSKVLQMRKGNSNSSNRRTRIVESVKSSVSISSSKESKKLNC